MYKHIEKLRERPEHHRRHVAFGVSAFVTSLIFVVWLSVLLPQSASEVVASKPKTVADDTPIETIRKSTAQVFDAFWGLIHETGENLDLQEEYNQAKSQVETGQIEIIPEQTGADVEN